MSERREHRHHLQRTSTSQDESNQRREAPDRILDQECQRTSCSETPGGRLRMCSTFDTGLPSPRSCGSCPEEVSQTIARPDTEGRKCAPGIGSFVFTVPRNPQVERPCGCVPTVGTSRGGAEYVTACSPHPPLTPQKSRVKEMKTQPAESCFVITEARSRPQQRHPRTHGSTHARTQREPVHRCAHTRPPSTSHSIAGCVRWSISRHFPHLFLPKSGGGRETKQGGAQIVGELRPGGHRLPDQPGRRLDIKGALRGGGWH